MTTFGYDWLEISAAGAENRPAALFVSGMSRQVILAALQSVKPPSVWLGAGYELTDAEEDEIDAAVSEAINEVMRSSMIGMIVPIFGNVEPDWGIFCDGRVAQKADYPELWEMAVAPYKGDTWFYVPNLRSRIIIGVGQGAGLSNYNHLQFGGAEAITLTESQMPPHSHQYYPPVLNIDLETPGVPDLPAAGVSVTTVATSVTGGGQSHPNIQPYLALYYVIVTPKP